MQKNLVKVGHVVFEICKGTDIQMLIAILRILHGGDVTIESLTQKCRRHCSHR